jgi:hypothetical protein
MASRDGLIKYASYDAHAFATDTRKLWVQVEYILPQPTPAHARSSRFSI